MPIASTRCFITASMIDDKLGELSVDLGVSVEASARRALELRLMRRFRRRRYPARVAVRGGPGAGQCQPEHKAESDHEEEQPVHLGLTRRTCLKRIESN